MRTLFYVVETEPGWYLCDDGQTSEVLDEAKVFATKTDAQAQCKYDRRVRAIKCAAGQDTVLMPE